MLKGIGASVGIGIGKTVKLMERPVSYADATAADPKTEKDRFRAAADRFTIKNEERAERMDAAGADGEILRGHIAMVNDPYMQSQIYEMIDSGMIAEKAVETVCDMFITMFSSTDDELTCQRAADVEDIKRQILKILLGIEEVDLKKLPADTVLVVEELTPSMTAEMDVQNIAGIVTEKGGVTSHSAILSRSLKIPAALSIEGALEKIADGADIIVDGSTGEVYTEYDENLLHRFLEKKKALVKDEGIIEQFKGKETLTADGTKKQLFANIGSHKDLASALAGDAEGIGLFRTEFLFMDRDTQPTEAEQFEAYKAVAVGMKGREVMIRTLDVGGDKDIPYLKLKKEENPFLGFRAVRYCLKNQELYQTQLRAILRASAYGNIAIMIPLVTQVDEVVQVRAIVQDIKRELDEKGIAYKKDIKIGIMVETPAACLIADLLAQHSDFFSIGTNDLTGYIMAADRGNADVDYLYSAFDPAVLRGIRHIIACAGNQGIPCGMCGEAAADPKLLPLLVSFGLDEFSVNPTNVLSVRAALSKLGKSDCDTIAEEVLKKDSRQEILQYLTSLQT